MSLYNSLNDYTLKKISTYNHSKNELNLKGKDDKFCEFQIS